MGKQWKHWQTLFWGAPKSLQMVTATMKLNDACSLEEKLWPSHNILKSRDITLATKVYLVKIMVFPVVLYGWESWTIKKAEHWRIDIFELWCWRRFLRVPWTARRSNQFLLKDLNPEYSLEGLMLKLKFQSFGHLMWRADSFEKTLMLEKIEGRRRRGATEDEMVGWHHWLNGHEFEQTSGDSEGQGSLACFSPSVCKELDTTEWLNSNNKLLVPDTIVIIVEIL